MWALVCLWLAVTLVSAQKVDLKEVCKKYGESVNKNSPNKNEDSCPISSDSYVGVKEASPREFPHMALLGYGDENNIKWLCGGNLISERFVLGAAHCVVGAQKVGPPKWVRLGEHNYNSTLDDEQGLSKPVTYEIAETTVHPDYSTTSVENDIALFKLKTDVQFNKYVRPTCLHTERQLPETFAQSTGWANTEFGGPRSKILQKLNVSITPFNECNNEYKDRGSRLKKGIIDDSMICAKSGSKEDLCQGGGGGPLQVVLKEPYCMYSIVGINSFGIKCGLGVSSVYTRVSHFVPWIQTIVWN